MSKNKDIRAKIVPGGSTGLEQQKAKRYPAPNKKEGIKKEIKESCKLQGEDLVLMQIGSYYRVIEEDAEYFHKNHKFRYTNTGEDFYVAGFHVSGIEKYKKELIENGGIDFCIVDEVFKEKGKNIIREVTFSSSNKKSLGLSFVGGEKK